MKTKKTQRCKEEDLEAGKELATEFPDAQLDNDGNIIHGVKEEKEYHHKKITHSELIKEIAKQTNHKYTTAQISAAIEKSQAEDNAKTNQELEKYLDEISGLEKGSTKKAREWAEKSGFDNSRDDFEDNLKTLGWVLVNVRDFERQKELSDAALICRNFQKLKITPHAFSLLCYLSGFLPIQYRCFHKVNNKNFGVIIEQNKKPSITKDVLTQDYLSSSWTEVSKNIKKAKEDTERNRIINEVSNNSRDLIAALKLLRKNGIITTFKNETGKRCRPTEYLCIDADTVLFANHMIMRLSDNRALVNDDDDDYFCPEETGLNVGFLKSDKERREKMKKTLLLAHSYFLS